MYGKKSMMMPFKGKESKKEEMKEMKMAGSKGAYMKMERKMEGKKSTSMKKGKK
jgi:hypothetical protein